MSSIGNIRLNGNIQSPNPSRSLPIPIPKSNCPKKLRDEEELKQFEGKCLQSSIVMGILITEHRQKKIEKGEIRTSFSHKKNLMQLNDDLLAYHKKN